MSSGDKVEAGIAGLAPFLRMGSGNRSRVKWTVLCNLICRKALPGFLRTLSDRQPRAIVRSLKINWRTFGDDGGGVEPAD